MQSQADSVVGANAGRSRNHNRQVVLARVRAAGSIGRAEIARASGLSTQAVSNIIADLLSDGLIAEQGRLAQGRGLPAVQYALNPRGGFAFGAEVRPDAVFAALLDFTGARLFEARVTQSKTSPEAVTATVTDLLSRALSEARVARRRVLGAGIVMPGPFGATGIRGSRSELPGWEEVDAAARFGNALGLPVFVENDANAAAMAERVSGVAQDLDTYAYLYFGAGLGLGLVQQGRLMAGAFGNAGEIGHILVPSAGASVELEDAVSRLSVARALEAAGATVERGEDLLRYHAQQHPALMKWLEAAAEPLGAAVATIENLFDPEAVILGGAMPSAILDELIARTPAPARSVSNRADRMHPRLMRGTAGRMTATRGAAALVINQAFTPMIAVAQ